MATSRRMNRDDRRAAFLDVAATIVDGAGVGALSFESLAESAGVAKTLPYAYFGSRDEILLTLFDRVVGGIDAEVDAVLSGDEPFDVLVRRSLEVWFDAVRDHGRLVGALLGARSVSGLADAIDRRDRASHKRWHDVVVDRVGLSDPDAHLLAAMLNATATATIELWSRRHGSRAALLDSFVVMATGAAASLASGTGRTTG